MERAHVADKATRDSDALGAERVANSNYRIVELGWVLSRPRLLVALLCLPLSIARLSMLRPAVQQRMIVSSLLLR